MDRFTELTAFVRTVGLGSQAAAAFDLGVTPAMVGRYIRALENRLGVRLLNRSTATQSLTEAGSLFHASATALLDDLEAAENAVAERQAAPQGRLRVAAPMVFGTRYLAGWLAGFGKLYPAVKLELTLNDRLVDLVEEGYDAALRIGQLGDSSLVARRLAPCRLVLCAAPSYLARRGTPADPEDLRAHECLLYSYFADGSVWRLSGPGGRHAAIAVGGALIANNGDALAAAAIAGAGIILQPSFIVGDALRAGRLIRLLPDWRAPDLAIHIVYPSARHLSPKVRAFADFLVRRLAGPPQWDEGLDVLSG